MTTSDSGKEVELSAASRWVDQRNIASPAELLRVLTQDIQSLVIPQQGESFNAQMQPPTLAMLGRMRELLRLEQTLPTFQSSDSLSLPILYRIRSNSGTAFDAAKALTALDLAVRRVDALVAMLDSPPREAGWPRPTHPNKCGLVVVDSAVGSFDALLTVYGSLVMVAQSAPVSLAALTSLVWDATKGARRIGSRWTAHIDKPAQRSASELGWHAQVMKSAMPAMREAITNGQPVRLTMQGEHGDKVEIVVSERKQAGATDTSG